MTKFEKLKAEFIEILRDKSPCHPEYRRVLASESQAELLTIIKDNLGWCIDKKALSNAFLIKFNGEILLASGLANTGLDNSGVANSGDRNSGDSNSGNWNSGNWNSGDSNSGYRNSGYRNSGNWNSGNWNSGDSNSGNWNSGNWNSGNWNSGDRNSGDSNSGYRNSGAFCTDANPRLVLFDVQTDILVRDWENHPACKLMWKIDPNIWVNTSEMTAQEKERFPTHETTGGFLKSIPYKEAWNNMWGNLTGESKRLFTNLPHFNPAKFFEITGITV